MAYSLRLQVLQPIYATHRIHQLLSGGLIADKLVTPPLEGKSTPVKATSDERRPEQELGKSREEPRVIHDNHSTNATRVSMDECIYENYNPQREVSAKSVTKPKDRVLRDKTNVAHYGTLPKKNNGAGKSKDTLATGTSYSPRKRQDDLTTTGWLCSPRKKKSSPSKETIGRYRQACLRSA